MGGHSRSKQGPPHRRTQWPGPSPPESVLAQQGPQAGQTTPQTAGGVGKRGPGLSWAFQTTRAGGGG